MKAVTHRVERESCMGELQTYNRSDPDKLRLFMKALLNDLRALEVMIARGMVESGIRRIGAEQEMFLVDRMLHPAPISTEFLERVADDRFKTELARFNAEFNLDPIRFGDRCLNKLERGFTEALHKASETAARMNARVVITGILPTLGKSDLQLDNMTPIPRYYALNDALCRLRGGAFDFRVSGTDELIIKHDSVMIEACNTSCQIHFQVSADEFARFYNIAQAVTGPVLAVAANSPLLFGRRLWPETRIALFQQAVDTRSPGHQLQERSARVSFGSQWIRESVLEIFREDIARFRVVLGIDVEEDPFAVLEAGGIPRLQAMQLHNSTVYRWNRPCYGVCDGKPHLRIENRVLPSGPSIVDEVANAAFWFGLISAIGSRYDDITELMEFDTAKRNFLAAARQGMHAQFTWFGNARWTAQDLVLKELLPLAREGLLRGHVADEDVEKYLGIIERRTATGRNGSQWVLDSLTNMKDEGTRGQQLRAVTAAMIERQASGTPVHDWPLTQLSDAGGWKDNYWRVEQYMTTDVFTVHEDEVLDLVANLMDWRHIRHVPVEDDEHRLIGLVSYRSLLRLLANDVPHGKDHPVVVRDVMHKNPITVSPETSTLDAIDLMRQNRVACLPVVKDDRLVGILTERDFMQLAAELVQSQLRLP